MVAMSGGAGAKEIILYDPQERANRFRWLVVPGTMAVRRPRSTAAFSRRTWTAGSPCSTRKAPATWRRRSCPS